MKIEIGECYYCGEPAKAWFQGRRCCKDCFRRLKHNGFEYLKDKLKEDKRNHY